MHDSKLARRTKVRALLQLAAYADQLMDARIDPTDEVHLVLGTGETTSHRLADLLPSSASGASGSSTSWPPTWPTTPR